jgi:hypothetical protein
VFTLKVAKPKEIHCTSGVVFVVRCFQRRIISKSTVKCNQDLSRRKEDKKGAPDKSLLYPGYSWSPPQIFLGFGKTRIIIKTMVL